MISPASLVLHLFLCLLVICIPSSVSELGFSEVHPRVLMKATRWAIWHLIISSYKAKCFESASYSRQRNSRTEEMENQTGKNCSYWNSPLNIWLLVAIKQRQQVFFYHKVLDRWRNYISHFIQDFKLNIKFHIQNLMREISTSSITVGNVWKRMVEIRKKWFCEVENENGL